MSNFQALDTLVERALAEKNIVGSVIMVARNGEIVYSRAAGMADREAGRAMEAAAIFRASSLTKPVVATTALAMIDRGILGLDHAVAEYLPYFQPKLADGREARITIRHLLTHTAGLSYGYPQDSSITTGMQNTDLDHEANLSRIAKVKLDYEPGTAWAYSVATDVLGGVIAKIHDSTLADAVAAYVTDPLGMKDSGFAVTDTSRLAVPYGDAKPEPVRMGEPHSVGEPNGGLIVFSPARIFNPRAFQSGGAGMVTTAPDYLRFLESIRCGGIPVIGPEMHHAATSNQIGSLRRDDAGQRFGFLGAIVDDPVAAQSPQKPGTYNWGGVYGHSWFVDPASQLSAISMTNTSVEGCLGAFPKAVRDAIYSEA